jgi:hypothetical protein
MIQRSDPVRTFQKDETQRSGTCSYVQLGTCLRKWDVPSTKSSTRVRMYIIRTSVVSDDLYWPLFSFFLWGRHSFHK